MPRRVTPRKIVAPPKFKYYKPVGHNISKSEKIELLYEEYEAIKLADYDMLNHNDAGELMGISRATFARIYEKARKKIALALVEGKILEAKFGNAYFDDDRYECSNCKATFNITENSVKDKCPICNNKNINKIEF